MGGAASVNNGRSPLFSSERSPPSQTKLPRSACPTCAERRSIHRVRFQSDPSTNHRVRSQYVRPRSNACAFKTTAFNSPRAYSKRRRSNQRVRFQSERPQINACALNMYALDPPRALSSHSNVARTKPNLLLSSGVVNLSNMRGLPSSVDKFPIRVCSVTK
jgi:hypothetical protein